MSELGAVVSSGLSAGEAAQRLTRDGPNALPVEQPPSRVHRFLAEYKSYMQIILVGAAIVSLVIKQWTTGIVLIVITLFNALIGLRQEGKAESAMNALQSMMKATARVRRDGAESQIPAEQLVVGDIVLIAAGDEVPADGRVVSSSALEIDESALTGESVPAAKDASTLSDADVGPGEQSNMAFMHTPVTHGSGVVVITATGSATQVGKIAHMLSATAKEETPLTKQMNTLTLWIVAAAAFTMIVMFILGASRGQSWKVLFDTAVALAIAAIPLALPMVVQVVLSLGSVELAKEKAIVKDLPSVETLGFTSAINSDKTGTLTMNQMTAVELVTPSDRYAITGSGYSLEGTITHAAGDVGHPRRRGPALRRGERREARRRQGCGRPDRGRPARVSAQGWDIHRRHSRRPAPFGDPALRPWLQADGHVQPGQGRIGQRNRALLRKRSGACSHGPGGDRAVQR